MYKIMSSDGTVLYDGSAPDSYAVSQGHCTREVGQAGSLAFTMSDPEDELYDSVGVMETYLSALDDDDEIFYGRVIDIDVNPITGEKQIQCAGALSFLEDGEIPPFSDASGQTMTAREFLELCVNAYNADIDDDERRAFTVGTVSHSQASASRTYVISSYTKAKSALENNLLGEYGGYFRARREDGILFLDWLEAYDESNASPITMTENLISQENAFTSNDLVTMIRPVGKNGITLPEDTIAISDSLVQRYGRIVTNVGFSTAETSTALRAKAEEYISRLSGGLGKTCTVKVIDMHYIDGTVPKIRLCSTYTDLEGFDGEDMVAASIDQDFMDPSNDTVTFKNARELTASTRKGGSGGIGKSTGRGNFTQNITNLYKHISETDDTLDLFADRININAIQIVEYAREFDQFATATSGAIDNINGTGVLQNSDHIVQAAGNFTRRYMVVPASKVAEVQEAGGNPHDHGWYIANEGYVVKETDVNSGIELYDSILSALNGESIPTASLNNIIGQTRTRMEVTSDTEVDPNKTYYTRTLKVSNGTSVVISENGHEVTIGEELDTITGSALWTQRDNITGIVGDFQVVYDSETGERRLVVLTGGGMSIRKDNVEYGLYDSGTLTAGILVEKLSDGVHTGTIDSQYYDDAYIEEKVTIYGDIIKLDVKNAVITETSTYIRAEVGAAASNIAYSVIEQAASYIRMEVSNAASSISESVIEQTSEYIESVVADVASGVAWSVISQTMTGIIQEVGRKSKIYRQWTNPNDGVNVLHDGDIWVKIMMRETWDDAASMTWDEASQYKWRDFYGVRQFVWSSEKNDWVQIVDTAPIIESTVDVELDNEHWAVVAHQLDLNQQAYDSNLSVTAQRINSDVSTAKSQIYSTIAQTATNITSEVVNVREGLNSKIEQTATSITSTVQDTKNGLESMIKQTSTNIYSRVTNETAQTYSTIEQTADRIASAVTDAKTSMGSLVMITATNVYSKVWNATSSTYSTFRQTSDSISTAVGAAKGELVSTIRQTATGIYTSVWDKTAETYSTILQTSTSIAAAVYDARSELNGKITVQANRINLVVDGNSTIKAAAIAASINAQTGTSTVNISADKIALDGNTTLAGTMYIQSGSLRIDKNVSIGTDATKLISMNSGKITADMVQLNTVKFIGATAGAYYDIGYDQVQNMIIKAEVVNNTLRMWKRGDSLDGNPSITFSKATTLAGNWNGGEFTVTASPQGNVIKTQIFDLTNNDISWSGNTATISVYANKDGGETKLDTGKKLTVDASGRYTAGYNSAHVTGSWSSNKFTYTKTNDSSKPNSDAVNIGIAAGAIQDLTGVYAYATKWTSSATTPTMISGTNKELTITDVTNNNNSVKLQLDGTDTGLTYTHGKYTAGYDSAHVSGSWSSNKFTYSKVSTSGKPNSDSVNVTSAIGSVPEKTGYYTYVTQWTSSQTTPAMVSGTDKKLTIANILSDNNSVKLQLAGVDTGLTFNHGKYNAGWTNCLLTGVKLNATGIVTINPGENSTVYLQVKENPGASSYTNKYYRQVKARSVILQTKTVTSNGTYTVDPNQGDGLGTVYVNVSSGATLSALNVYDSNSRTIASRTITKPLNVWAGAKVNNGSMQWYPTGSDRITITPGYDQLGVYDYNENAITSQTITSPLTIYGGVYMNNQWYWTQPITITPQGLASNIDLNQFQWLSQTELENLPSGDARRNAATLTNLRSLLSSNWTKRGYAFFRATLTNGSGEKWYRIATGS